VHLISYVCRAKTANKSEAAFKNNKEKAILEVTAGVREYFNVMLPNQLLYRQERAQYEEVKLI
jgi:mortality factor 4-like protein 1